jgi:hypothetical protein
MSHGDILARGALDCNQVSFDSAGIATSAILLIPAPKVDRCSVAAGLGRTQGLGTEETVASVIS